MDKQAVAKAFTVGEGVVILTTKGDTIQGYLSKFNLDKNSVSLQVAVYIGFDGKVEREDLIECKFDEIDTISSANPKPQPPTTFDADLKKVQVGKYLMIWGKHGASLNPTIEQGKLVSIDWTKRTLVLRSVNYEDQLSTVHLDKISFIDYTRSGPGAQGSSQTPDWHMRPDGAWYRGNREYGTNDDE
jgi:hypothetical protein